MGHIRCRMEQSMDAMSAITLDNRKTVRLGMFLDDVANIPVFLSGFNELDRFVQALVSDFHKILVLFADVPNEESFIEISVESSVVNCYVDIAEITIFQWSHVRNSCI